MTLSKPIFIPYQQADEPPRRAGIAQVPLSLEGLGEYEIQLVGHLVAAAEAMNVIFRDQFCADTPRIAAVLRSLIEKADGDLKQALINYFSMLNLQNAPWSLLPRKNHLLQADRGAVAKLAEAAGIMDDFAAVADYLFEAQPLNDRAGYYPHDLTEEELAGLGDAGKCVNTSVVRNEAGKLEGLQCPYNEERYKSACTVAITELKAARALTKDVGFRLYLDAKIEEMATGSEEARRLADYHWVRHNSPIDIIISTAIEVYLDNWKNAKGAAAGNVTIKNAEADALLKTLISKVPELEANAPWTYRRTEIDPETLPKLKFVDVACWTGDYVTGPMTTIAQSLPNDEWVGKTIGTVNMVYSNTGKAVHSISGTLIAEEFLPADIVAKYGDKLFDAGQLHSALHEIGHTTGKQDDDHQGEPRDYLEAEYSPLEEARAELFGMWSAERLREDGVIDADTEMATHYSMLLSMITSLKFEPNQAHIQARTMMWHVFMEKGAIDKVEEGGKTRFALNTDKLPEVVASMLKQVADIKAAGDKAAAAKLRETYSYTDDLKPEIEERTKDMPLGRGLVFPELVCKDGKYTGELRYPDFNDQRKFTLTLDDA